MRYCFICGMVLHPSFVRPFWRCHNRACPAAVTVFPI
jgi:hypothetical protein